MWARKAPYHYGWDWGPRFVTSGIWRPVALEAWDARASTTRRYSRTGWMPRARDAGHRRARRRRRAGRARVTVAHRRAGRRWATPTSR